MLLLDPVLLKLLVELVLALVLVLVLALALVLMLERTILHPLLLRLIIISPGRALGRERRVGGR